jgi:NADH-quinone oxidoreductase subunit L
MIPYAPWLVWLLPILGAILVPLFAGIHPKARNIFAVIVGFCTAALAISMIPDIFNGATYSETAVTWISIPGLGPFAGLNIPLEVSFDPLSIFMATVAGGIGALIVLYSLGYMAKEEGLTRYYFFMLFFIGGMVGLVMAGNFLQLYIFWEIVGLCSYALIGFWYKRPEARKAGMKAFIVTRVGDMALLIGIVLIYLNVGSFSFNALGNCAPGMKAILPTISLLLMGGAIGKSAQLPLHVWLPDAMEGPTTVSALIHAATMVKAGVYLMARTHLILSSIAPEVWLGALMWLGAITALVTATLGLVSVDIKRVLAYSTISQIGYMMLALGLSSTANAVFASQFHLMSHAVFKALLFLCAGAILHEVGTRDMREMGGLRRDMPITFITCVIGALALSAIPPFNGFWSKDYIFEVAYETGNYPILILAVLTAAVTFAYCLRMIALAFLGEKSDYARKAHIHEAPPVMTVPLAILAILTIITGFFGPAFVTFLGSEFTSEIHFSFVPSAIPVTLSVVALVLGGVPAYLVYYRKSVSAEKIRKGALAPIHKMLESGYYFDRAYYAVFVNGILAFVQKFRRTHPGILNLNISGIIAGLCIFIILIVLLGGL